MLSAKFNSFKVMHVANKGIKYMSKINFFGTSILFLAITLLPACQAPDFGELKPSFDQMKASPTKLLDRGASTLFSKNNRTVGGRNGSPIPLAEILDVSLALKNEGSDFETSLKYALTTDPDIIARQRDIEARSAAIDTKKAKKDFQVGTTVYGGVEDITDNTKGLALSLNASRLVFDGGELDSQINSAEYSLEAARMDLLALIDQRASELCHKWLELEKYKSLEKQINTRLSVLDPLIAQLEKVAKAGIGDVSKVTAAQRTVSAIRVEETKIAEGLAQAELEFLNAFGSLNDGISFDYDFVTNLVPNEINESLVQSSPLLKSQYAGYQASLATVTALRAKDGFDVGFEVRAMRPFAGSGYDSDESVGLVGRKTLFNGGMLESEIKEAEALAAAKLSQIKSTYRSGARSVQAALQNIESMEKAILIAKENASLTADEIAHLKQQLVIGGSTLDSVLQAEARLFNAESKEIMLVTEKYRSEVLIISSLGLFSSSLGF